MSEQPWCPGSGCASDSDVSERIMDALLAAADGGRVATGKNGDEMHGIITCPRCGRPVEIWACREWTFDCSKGDGWTETTPPGVREGERVPKSGEASDER